MDMKEIQLERNMFAYPGVGDPKWCQGMIDRWNRTPDETKVTALFRDGVYEIEIPTCYDPDDPDYNEELWSIWKGVDEEIEAVTRPCLDQYLSHFFLVTPIEYTYVGTKMLYYPPYAISPMHYDDELMSAAGGTYGQARPITQVIYLNQDFEGGEVWFPEQKVSLKPETGLVATFPGSFMYPHTTNPTCRKDRFILLPFYVKSGLNCKIEKFNNILDSSSADLKEYAALYDPGREIKVEGHVPLREIK